MARDRARNAGVRDPRAGPGKARKKRSGKLLGAAAEPRNLSAAGSGSGRPERLIGAAKFKDTCLKVLEELTPQGVVITKNGMPVARLTPICSSNADMIGSLKGKLTVEGDVFSTGLKWDAES